MSNTFFQGENERNLRVLATSEPPPGYGPKTQVLERRHCVLLQLLCNMRMVSCLNQTVFRCGERYEMFFAR